MILVINTADEKDVFIGLVDKQTFVVQKSFTALRQQSEKLLPAIEQFLKANKLKPEKLKGIAVVTGPGPFTALRIGVVTANTLAWSLKLPIAGVKLSEFKNLESLAKLISKKLKTKKRGIVLPFYGKQPNITKKKA